MPSEILHRLGNQALVILTKWSPRRSCGLPRKDLCTSPAALNRRVLTPEDLKLRSSFKRVDRRLASYGRKIVKKFVKSLAAFDVIQERLKRNPCPAKNRRWAFCLCIGDFHSQTLRHLTLRRPNNSLDNCRSKGSKFADRKKDAPGQKSVRKSFVV